MSITTATTSLSVTLISACMHFYTNYEFKNHRYFANHHVTLRTLIMNYDKIIR